MAAAWIATRINGPKPLNVWPKLCPTTGIEGKVRAKTTGHGHWINKPTKWCPAREACIVALGEISLGNEPLGWPLNAPGDCVGIEARRIHKPSGRQRHLRRLLVGLADLGTYRPEPIWPLLSRH
jgi:hypothetical protein